MPRLAGRLVLLQRNDPTWLDARQRLWPGPIVRGGPVVVAPIASAVRIVQQFLQSSAERRRKAERPGRIDLADANQVEQVDSVLEAPGDQFHAHERCERCNLKID